MAIPLDAQAGQGFASVQSAVPLQAMFEGNHAIRLNAQNVVLQCRAQLKFAGKNARH